MRRNPLESSILASVGYEAGTLEVEFQNASVYRYYNVPMEIYVGLMNADAPGSYLHSHIKTHGYRYEKIEESANSDWNQDTQPTSNISRSIESQKISAATNDTPVPITPPALLNAIRDKKLDVIRVLLKNNPKWVATKDQEGKTPLHHAVSTNDIAIVTHLIKCKAKVNAKDNRGISPLRQAINDHRIESAKCLIELGANVNETDENARSLLLLAREKNVGLDEMLIEFGAESYEDIFEAASNGTIEDVRYFLEQGEDVNEDGYGISPVHCALENTDVEVLKYLIAKGADVNAKDDAGNGLFSAAIFYGNAEAVRYFVEHHGAKINGRCCYREYCEDLDYDDYRNDDGDFDYERYEKDTWETPLHIAARYGSIDVLKYLVSKGANVRAKNAAGNMPLNVARGKYGDTAGTDEIKCILREAMERQQSVAIVPVKEKTAYKSPYTNIHEAAKKGRMDDVQYFVEKGGNINVKDDNGNTPLHWAAWSNSKDVVQYLISKGTEINVKNQWNDTPLHWAAEHNAAEVMQYLISNGADMTAKNEEGRTPLDVADTEKKKSILRLAMR